MDEERGKIWATVTLNRQLAFEKSQYNIFFFHWLVGDRGVRVRHCPIAERMGLLYWRPLRIWIEAQVTSKTRGPKLTFMKGTFNYVFIEVFGSLSHTRGNSRCGLVTDDGRGGGEEWCAGNRCDMVCEPRYWLVCWHLCVFRKEKYWFFKSRSSGSIRLGLVSSAQSRDTAPLWSSSPSPWLNFIISMCVSSFLSLSPPYLFRLWFRLTSYSICIPSTFKCH